MSQLLAVAMVPVVLYCLARAVAPQRFTGEAHRRDVDAWHVPMGLGMIGMLLGILSRPAAIAALVLSGLALCWGTLAVERRAGAGAHARLAVGATAMGIAIVPVAAPAQVAGADSMSGMSGMGGSWAVPVAIVLTALAVVSVTRVRALVRRSAALGVRLDAICDLVMTAAMMAMVVTLV